MKLFNLVIFIGCFLISSELFIKIIIRKHGHTKSKPFSHAYLEQCLRAMLQRSLLMEVILITVLKIILQFHSVHNILQTVVFQSSSVHHFKHLEKDFLTAHLSDAFLSFNQFLAFIDKNILQLFFGTRTTQVAVKIIPQITIRLETIFLWSIISWRLYYLYTVVYQEHLLYLRKRWSQVLLLVEEIQKTEMNYCKDIQLLKNMTTTTGGNRKISAKVSSIIRSLGGKKQYEPSQIIASQTLVKAIPSLHRLHIGFCKNLTSVKTLDEFIATITDFVPFLKAYSPYTSNYDAALDFLMDDLAGNKNQRIDALLIKVRRNKHSVILIKLYIINNTHHTHANPTPPHYSQPIQRLCRYPLLIAELSKKIHQLEEYGSLPILYTTLLKYETNHESLLARLKHCEQLLKTIVLRVNNESLLTKGRARLKYLLVETLILKYTITMQVKV